MTPKETRKYPTEEKTSTEEGKREYQRLYMRDVQARRKEEDARKSQWDIDAYNRLKEEFILDRMAKGASREDAEEEYFSLTIPPDKRQSDDMEVTQMVASDIAPEPKPELPKNEPFKTKDERDAERTQRLIELLNRGRALNEEIERRESVALATKVQAIEEAQEKEFESLVQKYLDRDPTISRDTAEETARWEMKQIQNAEIARNRPFQRKWQLMTDDEKLNFKTKLLRDSKKLRGE